MASKFLSLSLSLFLDRAHAQLRATAARVKGSPLGFLLRYTCSNLLFQKAESESKELSPSLKKSVLNNFESGGFKHTLKQECNGIQLQVAILLCTHQGQQFLAEQLESFKKQTHSNWHLWSSDDASHDQTKKFFTTFKKRIDLKECQLLMDQTQDFVLTFCH